MNLRTFILPIVFLAGYGGWWVYILYFLCSWQSDDNNYAGATAAIGLGNITVVIVGAYTLGFLIAALKSKENQKLFWLTIPLLFVPIASIALFEILK